MRADHRPERAIESRPRPVTDANFWLESPVSGNTALLVLSVSCLATIEEVGVTLGPVGVPGVFGFEELVASLVLDVLRAQQDNFYAILP